MDKITEIAFERLESLWESWCESRHANREQIINSIVLNIRIILENGTKEDIMDLLGYTDEFEDGLKTSVADQLRAAREKVLSRYLH